MNFVRCIPLLLFLLSGAFIFILGLILASERDGNISYLQGIHSLEKNSFKISQSSQQKEQTITQTVLVKSPIKGPTPTPPKKDDTQKGAVTAKDSAKLLQDFTKKLDASYLWGTYKPHLLHAITQRLPKPLTFGMIYLATEENTRSAFSYRDVKNSGWLADSVYHDGKQFSESSFENKRASFKLKNYFYKEKSTNERQRWHSVTTKDKSGIGNLNNKASLIFYFSIEDFDGLEDSRYLQYDAAQGVIKVMRPQGQDPLAYYKIVVFDRENEPTDFSKVEKFVYIDNTTPKRDTWGVKSILESKLNLHTELKFKTLPDNSELRHQSTTTNLIAIQLIFDQYGTSTVHVAYDDSPGADFTEIENHHRAQTITKYSASLFLPEFTNIFKREKGVKPSEETCGISAFSNLLSGIGYYYGKITIEGQEGQTQPNLPLYSGSPSKTEFPRGFLWDEGFHSLIYCQWNAEICIDVLRHWLNTQLDNGWIPREQLRGAECINNGNPDYIAQIRDEANPPTLIFMVLALMEYKERDELPKGASELLEQLYPKLKRWFDWFYTTQASEKDQDLFAWRSNHANEGLVLGSGLDDYPRGIDNNSKKPLAHLDLQVWMTFMAENMVKIAEFIGEKEDMKELQKRTWGIKANLDKFLDSSDNIYKDLVSTRDGQKEFANHFGYVNLFPLFFGYIKKDSPELDTLLDHMHSTVKIWSEYGLLSLARDDNKYMRTRDVYWGGPIWIPLNYLALRGLKLYYYDNEKARKIYDKLRENVIRNVCHVKEETGFFYEQFNQDNGRGQKNYPFTGWTAAVLPIIYEKY